MTNAVKLNEHFNLYYYANDEAYMYCDECDNLMVPTVGGYKCPVCGCEEGSLSS